jgi:predicted nicotinamide N-methyase
MAFSDSSEEGAMMDSLFTNTEYDERSWSFGGLTVRARTSNACSTDYDLTGQVPWPALTVLSHWLASDVAGALVRGRSCLELGAGTGITGILAAAQGCSALTLTDHNSYVVELLDQNIELNEEFYLHMAETPSAVRLDWGEPAPEPATLHLYAAEEGGAEPDGFGIILASDCLYCDAAVKPLFDTATKWLAPEGVLVMAHISRWDNVEAALAAELASRPELTVEEVDLTTFLPHAQPDYEPKDGEHTTGSLRVTAAAAAAL